MPKFLKLHPHFWRFLLFPFRKFQKLEKVGITSTFRSLLTMIALPAHPEKTMGCPTLCLASVAPTVCDGALLDAGLALGLQAIGTGQTAADLFGKFPGT